MLRKVKNWSYTDPHLNPDQHQNSISSRRSPLCSHLLFGRVRECSQTDRQTNRMTDRQTETIAQLRLGRVTPPTVTWFSRSTICIIARLVDYSIFALEWTRPQVNQSIPVQNAVHTNRLALTDSVLAYDPRGWFIESEWRGLPTASGRAASMLAWDRHQDGQRDGVTIMCSGGIKCTFCCTFNRDCTVVPALAKWTTMTSVVLASCPATSGIEVERGLRVIHGHWK